MRIGFDDVASGAYSILRAHQDRLFATSVVQALSLDDMHDLLVPLLVSPDVPYHVLFATEADVKRYVRLLYQRADEASNNKVNLTHFLAVIAEADERLRASRSRTNVEWNYMRQASLVPAVQVVWPFTDPELRGDGSVLALPHSGGAYDGVASLISERLGAPGGDDPDGSMHDSADPTAAPPHYLWAGLGTEHHVSAGVVFRSTQATRLGISASASPQEEQCWCVTRRVAISGLRGQPLALGFVEEPTHSVPIDQHSRSHLGTPSLEALQANALSAQARLLVVSSSANKLYLAQLHAGRLACSETSSYGPLQAATLSTKSQLLVLRSFRTVSAEAPQAGYTRATHVVIAGGSILGELVLLEVVDKTAASIVSPKNRHAEESMAHFAASPSMARISPSARPLLGGSHPSRYENDAPTHQYVVRERLVVGLHSGPLADVVRLRFDALRDSSCSALSDSHEYCITAGASDGKLMLVALLKGVSKERLGATKWTYTKLREVDAHRGGISCMAFAQSRLLLLTAGTDTAVKLWSISLNETNTVETLVSSDDNAYLVCSALHSQNGDQFLALDMRGRIQIWDARTRHRGALVAAGLTDRLAKVTTWTSVAQVPTGALISLTGGPASVLEPAVATDPNIVKACDETEVQAFHSVPASIHTHGMAVTCAHCNVKVWNTADGDLVSVFDSVTPAPAVSVRIVPDADWIVCGLATGEVVILSLQTGLVMRRLAPHAKGAPVRAVMIGAGACGLFSSTDDGPVWTPFPKLAGAGARSVKLEPEHPSSDHASGFDVDDEGRVGVLRAESHRLRVYQIPESSSERVETALSVDLTPALKAIDQPTTTFAFVEALSLIAIADGSDLSLLEIDGPRARRRASWSMQTTPAAALYFVPRISTLVSVDTTHGVWVEGIAPAIEYRGPDSDAPGPTAVASFSLLGRTPAAEASAPVLTEFLTDVECISVALPSREVLFVALDGTTCGRLDMSCSSGNEWRVRPMLDGSTRQNRSPTRGLDVEQPEQRRSRRREAVRLRHAEDSRDTRGSSGPTDVAFPVRLAKKSSKQKTMERVAKLAGKELPADELPAQFALDERSTRTTMARVTGPTQWSVDYPEDLVEQVRREDKSNQMIAGLPELHASIRRLRPSAKVLDEDRRERKLTHDRIVANEALKAYTPPPRLRPPASTFSVKSPDAGDGRSTGTRLPSVGLPPMHRTAIPAHGLSPRRAPRATMRLQTLIRDVLNSPTS